MRPAVAVVLLLLPLTAGAFPAPEQETPWWERTLLDADRDGLDDALAPLLSGDEPLTVILGYARAPTPAQRDAALARAELVLAPVHFPMLVVRAPARDVPALRDLPGVVLVEKNDEIRPLLDQSVPLTGAPQAWSRYGVTGEGIVVAVLDDGAYERHPDFDGKIAASYNAAAASARVPFGDDVVVPAGEQGHGTHVAGTIVGEAGEAGGRYKGVAPGARFANVQVFAGPNQTSSEIVLRGLDWVLEQREALNLRVASLSLGGRMSDGTDALSRAVNIAVDEGLVVIAAAGNAGPGEKTVTSPGSAVKAVTVGAVDKRKVVASFSSRGPTPDGRIKPDLVAPGKAIVSTIPPASTSAAANFLGGDSTAYYGSLSGTSMAAPHVAGVAALMLEANPRLSPFDVKRTLLATAQDLGRTGPDNDTGYGFVNAIAAVQVARNPSILQQAQFRSVLATIPEPPPESFLDRASFRIDQMARDGSLALYGLAAAALLAAVVAGIVVARRRRDPPALPPP